MQSVDNDYSQLSMAKSETTFMHDNSISKRPIAKHKQSKGKIGDLNV